MNKKWMLGIIGSLVFSIVQTRALAQFVNIRIEIAPGVNFSSQVVQGNPEGTWEKDQARVWIQIGAQDNLSLLIELSYPDREILPRPFALFLNDGSSNFENSSILISGKSRVDFVDPPVLIRNQKPRPQHFTSWLGLPRLDGIHLKIEY
jgi:hypothetical protein